jgi:HEAT repeat protein
MGSRLRSVLIVAALVAAACSDADDDIRANVTILVNHEGALATAAAEHLVRYGRRAIPTIEAAMHTASGPGRKNLIMALRKIGDAEAVPLLGHIAVYDPSPDVQREAVWTLKQWADDGRYADRAARAREALRNAEEARKAEGAG